MTAMFPDSGVPPSEARNSLPDPTTQNCEELWYSTQRCTPRFDPAAANAVLSELVNLINKGEVNYDCAFLNQVQLAVRYLTQRGLMSGALATQPSTANAYAITLDPPITRYNDYMTVRLVPTVNNTGPVTIDGGLGSKVLLRNDGQPMQKDDLRAAIPFEAIYFQEKWYYVGMVMSQLPRRDLTANLNLYVNWGIGNDANDGTAPDAAHVLKNIQRAVDIAFNYAPSQYQIIVHIADSLNYRGCGTPIYAGPNILMLGNEGAPQNVLVTGNGEHCFVCNGINNMQVLGVTVATTAPDGNQWGGFIAANSAIISTKNTRSNNVAGPVFEAFSAAHVDIFGTHTFNGDSQEWFWAMINGHVVIDDFVNINVAKNLTVSYAVCYAAQGASYSESTGPVYNLGGFTVTGKRYQASLNGTINTLGKGPNRFPGTIAGTTDTGGQYA